MRCGGSKNKLEHTRKNRSPHLSPTPSTHSDVGDLQEERVLAPRPAHPLAQVSETLQEETLGSWEAWLRLLAAPEKGSQLTSASCSPARVLRSRRCSLPAAPMQTARLASPDVEPGREVSIHKHVAPA